MENEELHIPKKPTPLQKYWPLFTLIIVAILAALALSSTRRTMKVVDVMHFFMGFFLCQFALLKIFHPKKFAEGFQKYDLIASRSYIYALWYPLIELALGLGYLSFFFSP